MWLIGPNGATYRESWRFVGEPGIVGEPPMAISLDEALVSLTDATKLIPLRRGGKRIHVSCLYRWGANGLRGVRLETAQVGGTVCTSKQALERFFTALEWARRSGSPQTPPKPAIPARRVREIAEASRQAAEALA